MQFADILSTDGIFLDVKCQSKKQLFQHLAAAAETKTGLEKSVVFDALNAREKLGSTGLGEGVAIPHGRVEGASECHLLVAKLSQPVNFDSDDGMPVDLVFCLLGCHEAKNEPVKIVSRVSRLSADPSFRETLRAVTSVDDVYALLTCERMQLAA